MIAAQRKHSGKNYSPENNFTIAALITEVIAAIESDMKKESQNLGPGIVSRNSISESLTIVQSRSQSPRYPYPVEWELLCGFPSMVQGRFLAGSFPKQRLVIKPTHSFETWRCNPLSINQSR